MCQHFGLCSILLSYNEVKNSFFKKKLSKSNGVHDPSGFDGLNRKVKDNSICCRLNIKKNIYPFEIFLKTKPYFSMVIGCFYTHQVDYITSRQLLHYLILKSG